ncbi:hypothetical protein [Undibacterium parvum]|nr:hypothetical protein [Undibacterium parvum]AZP10810.1 hypothetical protein EJN92_01465 [Undibacterium parvum]
MNIWISAIAAVAAQPMLLLLRMLPDYLSSPQSHYGIGFVLFAVVAVSATLVLVLGVPAFLALRKLRRDSWRSLGIVGFVLGALSAATSWPSRLDGYSAGQNWHGKYIETYVDGVPTAYAWFTYAEGVALFALHGVVGALVFYGVWRWRQYPKQSLQRRSSDGG